MTHALRLPWWSAYDMQGNRVYSAFERGFWRVKFDYARAAFFRWLHRIGWWELPKPGHVVWAGRLTTTQSADSYQQPQPKWFAGLPLRQMPAVEGSTRLVDRVDADQRLSMRLYDALRAADAVRELRAK
jgi:hypothetical protein